MHENYQDHNGIANDICLLKVDNIGDHGEFEAGIFTFGLRDFLTFSRIFYDFLGFSRIFYDFLGFSTIFSDFQFFDTNVFRYIGGT